MRLRVRPFFRWYDLWVGVYVDRANRALYFCPLPMLGVKFWLVEPFLPIECVGVIPGAGRCVLKRGHTGSCATITRKGDDFGIVKSRGKR